MYRLKKSAQRLRNQRVRAAVDLPGVPAGTGGRVKLTNGFTWTRYWVIFDNGVEHGSLDPTRLEFVDKDGRPVEV